MEDWAPRERAETKRGMLRDWTAEVVWDLKASEEGSRERRESGGFSYGE